ncbi:hypothetical protein OPV22_033519 [Ensete ventricosum]|uniref:Protein kinase domain-containing protein n=1 Tax=Ensete ventricosum TaxID=4639 RepID=A0AAV8Q1L8_ENSVE|nr:hypothetical protein OPV22_033519 [Ensete ventricosum]
MASALALGSASDAGLELDGALEECPCIPLASELGEAVEWDLVLVGALAVHLVANTGPPKSLSKALNLITRGREINQCQIPQSMLNSFKFHTGTVITGRCVDCNVLMYCNGPNMYAITDMGLRFLQ